jgi:hypothetical protein
MAGLGFGVEEVFDEDFVLPVAAEVVAVAAVRRGCPRRA